MHIKTLDLHTQWPIDYFFKLVAFKLMNYDRETSHPD